MTTDSFEENFTKLDNFEKIMFLQNHNFLKKEMKCVKCSQFMKLDKFAGNKDGYIWRCKEKGCPSNRTRASIREGSFFKNINLTFLQTFKVLIRWSHKTPTTQITENLKICPETIRNLIQKFINLQVFYDFSNNKVGGYGKIVQVDETMLNFKCKSHRGRSASNKSDALCIVEYDGHITRAYAELIPNKAANTLLPIICHNVVNGATIWTDEHKSYSALAKNGFIHQTVCHKYSFINKQTGANTQAVESFNNELKLEIKRRKGIITETRSNFLKEFLWLFNNKINRFDKILERIKMI